MESEATSDSQLVTMVAFQVVLAIPRTLRRLSRLLNVYALALRCPLPRLVFNLPAVRHSGGHFYPLDYSRHSSISLCCQICRERHVQMLSTPTTRRGYRLHSTRSTPSHSYTQANLRIPSHHVPITLSDQNSRRHARPQRHTRRPRLLRNAHGAREDQRDDLPLADRGVCARRGLVACGADGAEENVWRSCICAGRVGCCADGWDGDGVPCM